MRRSRYLASVAGAGGTFFEELGLRGAAKTGIEIEHFHIRILNFTIVSDEGSRWLQNSSKITGTDNGYKKCNDKYTRAVPKVLPSIFLKIEK